MHGEEPTLVMAAGDAGGDAAWVNRLAHRAATRLERQPVKIILQAGDFGIEPGPPGDKYRNAVLRSLRYYDVRLWFVDGNHDWPEGAARLDITGEDAQYLNHLPRGHRWEWHGRTWLAMGGGVSLDKGGQVCPGCEQAGCGACHGTGWLRPPRVEGESWWPGEEITLAQAEAAIAAGPADVLLAHDCPARVTHSWPGPRRFSWQDLARQEQHAELLQCITSGTRPRHVIHGHLSRGYQRTCDFGYGPVEVTGLNDQWQRHSHGFIDVKNMTWDVEA